MAVKPDLKRLRITLKQIVRILQYSQHLHNLNCVSIINQTSLKAPQTETKYCSTSLYCYLAQGTTAAETVCVEFARLPHLSSGCCSFLTHYRDVRVGRLIAPSVCREIVDGNVGNIKWNWRRISVNGCLMIGWTQLTEEFISMTYRLE